MITIYYYKYNINGIIPILISSELICYCYTMSAFVWGKLLQRDPVPQQSYLSPIDWDYTTTSNHMSIESQNDTNTINNHLSHIHDTTAFSIPWANINKTKYYTLMPVCNIGVRLLTYPFNLIKTRISSTHTIHYNGTVDAMKQIIRNEGFLALYKGLPVSCFTLTTAPIYLTVLETSRTEFELLCATNNNQLKSLVPSAAGFVASAVQQLFAVPLDVVTQRMMVSRGLKPVRRWPTQQSQYINNQHLIQPSHNNDNSKNSSRTARTIVRDILSTQGWRGLYRGFVLSVVQYAPFSAITWQVNSTLDPWLRQTFQSINPIDLYNDITPSNCNQCANESTRIIHAGSADGFYLNPNHIIDKPHKPRPLTVRDVVVSMVSGGVSGMIACLATTPIDVIKTRIQVNESSHKVSSSQTIQAIMKERGFIGLAAGTTARVMAVAPSSALLMVSYEVLKRYSLKHELYQDD